MYFHLDLEDPTLHSLTTMGSGAFPSSGYPVAAYYRNISYADVTGTVYDGADLAAQTVVTNGNCYDIAVGAANLTDWGTYFFFGGSGGNNAACTESTLF